MAVRGWSSSPGAGGGPASGPWTARDDRAAAQQSTRSLVSAPGPLAQASGRTPGVPLRASRGRGGRQGGGAGLLQHRARQDRAGRWADGRGRARHYRRAWLADEPDRPAVVIGSGANWLTSEPELRETRRGGSLHRQGCKHPLSAVAALPPPHLPIGSGRPGRTLRVRHGTPPRRTAPVAACAAYRDGTEPQQADCGDHLTGRYARAGLPAAGRDGASWPWSGARSPTKRTSFTISPAGCSCDGRLTTRRAR